MRYPDFYLWMVVLSIMAGPSFGESAYRVIEVEKGGEIAGSVKLLGKFPAPRKLIVARDQAVCGQSQRAEDFIVDPKSKGLKNVVITIQDIAAGKSFAATTAPVISQVHCVYLPHVQVFQPQTKLTIRNNDQVLHNIHAYAGEQVLFNIAQPSYVKKWPVRLLSTSEVINVQCDMHEWMSAYLIPVEHPYAAVTDESGGFSMDQAAVSG